MCQVKVREAEIFLTFAQCQERVTKGWRPLPCKPDSVPSILYGLRQSFISATITRGLDGRAALPLFCLAL